ncbi:MAG TPA: sulfide/dihydroorotate dehydrogenase-like FAD/NAD-binding protein, partial [Candidatus Olsenella pullistercoris]|nr:sulfide/dihydroorotate dehydrogenase-like FAD/NAD-binding protein [Candidatus Olsenella pullistercoris]
MYKILEKTQFSEKVFKFRIEAPRMAKHAHAGQFLMVRANETGERVPFTLAGWNAEEGWVEFIFMVIGKTTEMLSSYEAGDSIKDVTGPLGVPTEMADGPCAVIGGGVGLAIAYPVARHLVETGHEVHAIMGARTKDLLLLEEQFRELLPEDHIHITTDDGSYGEKGVVTAPLERLLQAKAVSQVFCVGPVPMMKFSALTAEKYGTP